MLYNGCEHWLSPVSGFVYKLILPDLQCSFNILAKLKYRKQARANLTSPQGELLRKARSTEVETVFGHLKHNQGFRRFHLRGMEKVKTEWGIVSIAHNMGKMAV
jgi:hypothetical protein